MALALYARLRIVNRSRSCLQFFVFSRSAYRCQYFTTFDVFLFFFFFFPPQFVRVLGNWMCMHSFRFNSFMSRACIALSTRQFNSKINGFLSLSLSHSLDVILWIFIFVWRLTGQWQQFMIWIWSINRMKYDQIHKRTTKHAIDIAGSLAKHNPMSN